MGVTSDQRRSAMQAAYDREATRLLAALDAPPTDLPGMPDRPDAEDIGAALARNGNRLAEARAAVRALCLARDEVADLLGVSTQQISNLLRDGKLVALDGPSGQDFPRWQFDPDARSPRLAGVELLVAAFPGGVVSLSLWADAPNPVLAGRTPTQALRDGDVDLAFQAARAVYEP